MKIFSHAFLEGVLQHSVVEHDGEEYLRVARRVHPLTGGLDLGNVVCLPIWAIRESLNGIDDADARELETLFVDALIQNVDPLLTSRAAGATVGDAS